VNIPEDRRYTDQHEWVLPVDGGVRIGITDYAQDALGDVVFIDLPEAGREVAAGESIAEVESTKSVAEIYAPIAGTITSVNTGLADNPELINSDPYGAAWFFLIAPTDAGAIDEFLDSDGRAPRLRRIPHPHRVVPRPGHRRRYRPEHHHPLPEVEASPRKTVRLGP